MKPHRDDLNHKTIDITDLTNTTVALAGDYEAIYLLAAMADVNDCYKQVTDVNEVDQQETDVNEGNQLDTDDNEDHQQETDDNEGDKLRIGQSGDIGYFKTYLRIKHGSNFRVVLT